MARFVVSYPGSHGVALALLLAREHKVDLLLRDSEKAKQWQKQGFSDKVDWLKKVKFPKQLSVISNKNFQEQNYDYIFLASPSKYLHESVVNLGLSNSPPPLVTVQKSLTFCGTKLTTAPQYVRDVVGSNAKVFSCTGPVIAEDIQAGNFPLLITGSGTGEELSGLKEVCSSVKIWALANYQNADYLEMTMALRPMMSLVTGIAQGAFSAVEKKYGFSSSTRSFFQARVKVEMDEVVEKIAGKICTSISKREKTILEADEQLCSTLKSRNYQYGLLRGKGQSHPKALKECKGVVEGYATLEAVCKWLDLEGKDWHEQYFYLNAVRQIVFKDAKASEFVPKMLERRCE